MNKITTIASLPTLVVQYFNASLLSTPMITFGENSSVIWRVWLLIKKHLDKRLSYNISDSERSDLMKMEKEFKEKYEWIKKKEEELESEDGHETKRPFYYFTVSSKRDGLIYERLKWKKC